MVAAAVEPSCGSQLQTVETLARCTARPVRESLPIAESPAPPRPAIVPEIHATRASIRPLLRQSRVSPDSRHPAVLVNIAEHVADQQETQAGNHLLPGDSRNVGQGVAEDLSMFFAVCHVYVRLPLIFALGTVSEPEVSLTRSNELDQLASSLPIHRSSNYPISQGSGFSIRRLSSCRNLAAGAPSTTR